MWGGGVGNTRTIGQDELTKLRDEVTAARHDPYVVLLRQKNLPQSLIYDAVKVRARRVFRRLLCSSVVGGDRRGSNVIAFPCADPCVCVWLWASVCVWWGVQKGEQVLTEKEPFDKVFGPKKQRKKPKLAAASMDELAATAAVSGGTHSPSSRLMVASLRLFCTVPGEAHMRIWWLIPVSSGL